MDILDAVSLDVPRFELRKPDARLRHDKAERIVRHRFPIKGGLTGREVNTRLAAEVAEVISLNNALFARLMKRAAK
jgi:hypothetical protein